MPICYQTHVDTKISISKGKAEPYFQVYCVNKLYIGNIETLFFNVNNVETPLQYIIIIFPSVGHIY